MSDRLVVTAQGQRVWQRLRRRSGGPRVPRPRRVVALLYLVAIQLTTVLLLLPIATLDRKRAPFPVTLFHGHVRRVCDRLGVRRILRGVARFSIGFESVIAVI